MFTFRKKVIGKRNKKIIFLICGWPGKIWHYFLTAKILELNGYQSIIYDYDDSILSSSIKETIINTNLVKKDILEQVKILKSKGYKDFSIFGTSYGTIISFLVCDVEKNVSKLIINLTGHDLAEIVWSWNKGKDSLIKKELISKNITLLQLKEKWRQLSPINNINNLQNRKVLVYLAENDEVIPYKFQIKLLKKLKSLNKNTQFVSDTKHGHLVSALINLLKYKKYINFLNN